MGTDELYFYRDADGENPFEELCYLAPRMLTFPHSNTDVERIFSQLNIVKNRGGPLAAFKTCWD